MMQLRRNTAMPALSRPMGGRSSHTPWGFKAQRTISVSEEAWGLWTNAAEKAGINRSELFEVTARSLIDMDITDMRSALLAETNA
jgi:hypothetical protein